MRELRWLRATALDRAVSDSAGVRVAKPARNAWATRVSYASFTLAGIGCALPGALLPALQVSWHLRDSGAGVFFLVIASGSALGALLPLWQLWHSLLLAFGLLAMTAVVWGCGLPFVVSFGLAWGLGLGMLTTSISLLRQRVSSNPTVELVRLNLLWAAGACVCPALMTRAMRTNSPRGVLLVFVGIFLALGLANALVGSPGRTSDDRTFDRPVPSTLPARFGLENVSSALIVSTVLSTGIEASGGAWLASYARRSHGGLILTIAAPTCLWAGLLLSRFLASLANAGPLSQRSLRGLLVLAAVAASGLLVPSRPILALSAFALGFGLGPLYPSLLARVMQQRQNGSIFFLCGVASALLPLLTGLMSNHFVSLRAGLLVPATGALVLMLAGLRYSKVWGEAL